MKILVTGGTGFIGSHTVVELLENNYEVVIVDDFSNSKKEVLDNIKKITNKSFSFYKGNVKDEEMLSLVFEKENIDAVIHFAGFKAIGESVDNPLMYYENNIDTTISLCKVMDKYNCHKLIFSSTATVYDVNDELPLKEDFPKGTTNPYSSTKLMIERILKDLYVSNNDWSIVVLRYFNPIGAHESGLIGENPQGIPNNLMPYILKVAIGELECLTVFGNDYDTKDGTGVRDYIHVVDLAKGHIKAIDYLTNKGIDYFNLGTGVGYSVLDIVNTFESVNGIKINYKIGKRRSGDIAEYYADSSKAEKLLGFKVTKTIEDMCKDSYNYILKNK